MLIELDSRTLDGRLFQSLAPLTQKKLSRKSSLARGTLKGRNDCWWRVFGSLLCWSVNNVLCSMFQNPRRNLNISIASPRCQLSSRVVRPSCFIVSGFEPLMLLIRRVARRWIFSKMSMSFCSHGDHAGAAYSRCGLTNTLKIWSMTSLVKQENDQFTCPRTWFAFLAARAHYSCGRQSSEIVTPRSFWEDNVASFWPSNM